MHTMRADQQSKSTVSLDSSCFPPLIRELGNYFSASDNSAYLVGGVVRDAFLKRPTNDIDLAISSQPKSVGKDIAELVDGRAILLDKSREIVRVAVPNLDGVKTIDLTPMGNRIEENLGRRDFTLDAISISLQEACTHGIEGKIIDPHGGLKDLEAGVIKALSPSVFTEDPLRIMRGPRLAAQLGFRLEMKTEEWIRRYAKLVLNVAPERVRDELLKLLAEPNTTYWLRLLDDLGLLRVIIPELEEARGVVQPKEHYWDVLEHCMETPGQVERILPQGDPIPEDFSASVVPRFESIDDYFNQEIGDGHNRLTMLKLAGLLHDIAKPATKTVESSGRIRFLGHHRDGAEMAEDILSRLRFSGKWINLVNTMVESHLRPGQMSNKGAMPTSRAIYRYYRDVGEAAIDTLYLNMADYLAARGPLLEKEEWINYCATIRHILKERPSPGEEKSKPNLIDGHDIMKIFSLAPGPKIGALLELVKEAEGSSQIGSKDEAIQLVKSKLSSGGQ